MGCCERFFASRSVTPARAAAIARFIDDFEGSCAARSIACFEASDLRAFLDAKLAAGFHPNTVRKWLVMARTLATWLYEQHAISAETLLAIRAVRPPAGSSKRPQPQPPYSRTELSHLWTLLDERWPRMEDDRAHHYAVKWRERRTPYSRIRRHAIRLQLEAVIALALHCGLRKSEILRLDERSMHTDNEGVVVWDEGAPWSGGCREVPYSDEARELIAPWMALRFVIAPVHARAWLKLHARTTVREPMNEYSFSRLLGTYVGPGWTFRRLRDTCGLSVQAPMPAVRVANWRALPASSIDPHRAIPSAATPAGSRRLCWLGA